MHEGFLAISDGWTLVGFDELTERIEALAEWSRRHSPLEPDEEATVRMMIESQIARGGWLGGGDEDYGPPRCDEEEGDA